MDPKKAYELIVAYSLASGKTYKDLGCAILFEAYEDYLEKEKVKPMGMDEFIKIFMDKAHLNASVGKKH